ncbi:MAG TPA: biotin transporter BioY [Firmicutes bacterium]|nr:biotin transporter BioY [Bacillota bacterium]
MTAKRLVFIGLFACLTVLGALISIPTPLSVVPVTLQIPFTLSAGFVLGPKDGAISQLLYLLVGAVGLPVFARQLGGFSVLIGPTAGFLWGFVFSAVLTGLINRQFCPNKVSTIFLSLFLGLLLIYSLGVVGLIIVLEYNLVQAVASGVAPFVIVDLIKLLVAAYLINRLIKAKIIRAAS